MKFVLNSKEALKSELLSIPWANAFLASKILVVGIKDDGSIGAVCGIRSVFNILTLYVCKQSRGRGIGKQILKKTIDVARQRHLVFILLGVPYRNTRAFRLYFKFGFKEVVYLKKLNLRIMMLSMDFAGEAAYLFLCTIVSLLPNLFWTYIEQWIHDRTVSSDEGD